MKDYYDMTPEEQLAEDTAIAKNIESAKKHLNLVSNPPRTYKIPDLSGLSEEELHAILVQKSNEYYEVLKGIRNRLSTETQSITDQI